ncbi:hypothetical protein V1T76_26435 [Roseibium sp. FZY0029]|uniref:hypothetical protein n=1 Tax=Roseibium sp. FZY0029 TaxID=3116647 RepID=UPI002EB83EA3|nr:hypothetical protein [Roseibium sp. FZY0029]
MANHPVKLENATPPPIWYPQQEASSDVPEAGLRSDGELVQASPDSFNFTAEKPVDQTADHDHKDWTPILSIPPGATEDGSTDHQDFSSADSGDPYHFHDVVSVDFDWA